MVREEAARLVAVMVAATAQGARLDGKAVVAMVDAYASLLADLPYARCDAAVRSLVQSQPFIPAVSEIRAAVLELERGPVRPGGEAWGSVKAAMRCEGSYKTPGLDFVFRDPVTARCVDALGWQEMCKSELEAPDRARFIELYDRLAKQERREAQVPLLAAAREARQVSAGSAINLLMTQISTEES